jgi:hypothetical protein
MAGKKNQTDEFELTGLENEVLTEEEEALSDLEGNTLETQEEISEKPKRAPRKRKSPAASKNQSKGTFTLNRTATNESQLDLAPTEINDSSMDSEENSATPEKKNAPSKEERPSEITEETKAEKPVKASSRTKAVSEPADLISNDVAPVFSQREENTMVALQRVHTSLCDGLMKVADRIQELEKRNADLDPKKGWRASLASHFSVGLSAMSLVLALVSLSFVKNLRQSVLNQELAVADSANPMGSKQPGYPNTNKFTGRTAEEAAKKTKASSPRTGK